MRKFRLKLFLFITGDDDNSSGWFDRFIIWLILANCFVIVLESVSEVYTGYRTFFQIFEFCSVVIFTGEYFLRLFTAEFRYKVGPLKSAWRHFKSPMSIIDILAVLPFYLPLVFPFDLRILRILRVFRLLRVLKLFRYSRSLRIVAEVLREKKDDLAISALVMFIFLLISSTLMFYIENESQPEAFSSILASFWWAVATLTTVGYGDVVPVTGAGKFISGVMALLGIGLIAMPTGIISAAFIYKLDGGHGEATKSLLSRFGQRINEARMARMVHIRMTRWKTKTEYTESFKEAGKDFLQKISPGTNGLIRFDLYQSDDAPEHFTVLEIYTDDESRSQFYATPVFVHWRRTAELMAEEEPLSDKFHPCLPEDK